MPGTRQAEGDDVGAGVVLEERLPVALEPGMALELAGGPLQAEVDAAVDAVDCEEPLQHQRAAPAAAPVHEDVEAEQAIDGAGQPRRHVGGRAVRPGPDARRHEAVGQGKRHQPGKKRHEDDPEGHPRAQ